MAAIPDELIMALADGELESALACEVRHAVLADKKPSTATTSSSARARLAALLFAASFPSRYLND